MMIIISIVRVKIKYKTYLSQMQAHIIKPGVCITVECMSVISHYYLCFMLFNNQPWSNYRVQMYIYLASNNGITSATGQQSRLDKLQI